MTYFLQKDFDVTVWFVDLGEDIAAILRLCDCAIVFAMTDAGSIQTLQLFFHTTPAADFYITSMKHRTQKTTQKKCKDINNNPY